MRAAVSLAAIVLGACSLDLADDDVDVTETEQPATCDHGPRYFRFTPDCGPVPPGTPPRMCPSTVDFSQFNGSVDYCYGDVCDLVTYQCTEGVLVAERYSGFVDVATGHLIWDGADFEPGSPYQQ
jgi:hypothetical protein